MADIIIQHARLKDAPNIAEIWNKAIAETTITFTTSFKTTDLLEEQIATRGAGFQVALEEDRVIGFATFFQFRDGPGYAHAFEHSIFLADACQGRGIGKALMQVIEQEVRACAGHTLWAGVSGENQNGIAFHRKMGFDTSARFPQAGRKFGRWLDLVLMQKILSP